MPNLCRNMGLAGLAGIVSAALFVLSLKDPNLSAIGLLTAPVPLAMAGFAFSFTGLVIAAVTGILAAVPLSSPAAAVFYVISSVLPTMLLTGLCLKNRKNENGEAVWYPIGYALSWTSVVTALLMTFILFVILFFYAVQLSLSQSAEPVIEETVAAVSENFFSGMNLQDSVLKFLTEALSPTLSVVAPDNYGEILKHLAAGFIASMSISWLCVIMFAAWVAESILVRFGSALRKNPEYVPMYVQNWLLVLVAMTGIVAGTASSENVRYLASNFTIAISLPFCLLGLTQIHVWARSVPYTKVILVVFYVLLSLPLLVGIGLAEVLCVLAVIGLYEQFVRIYKRYIRHLENGEK